MATPRFQFRDLAPGAHFATASDRYAGWLGQIYSSERGYKITRTQKTVKGKKCTEEKLPVRSVEEYFQHYTALEIDFTFYGLLLDEGGAPTRILPVLKEYAKWVPEDAVLVIKVPEIICAPRRWITGDGERTFGPNPDYLNSRMFTDQFYRPAVEILGHRAAAFVFEKGYQKKDSSPPPEENIAALAQFFDAVPQDLRYHVEERTDRLKTRAYFDFLRSAGIGNVFSHWTWLPDLPRQWEQAGGFTSGLSVTRLLTPRGMTYEETYARYHPFDRLIDELPHMYRDAADIIRHGMKAGIPTVTVANNRAGGNANEINRRIAEELSGALPARQGSTEC